MTKCFAQNLRYFRAIFFLRTFAHETQYVLRSFAQFAQNRKYYAKRNFLSKLTKIDILSKELNNWRFILLLHRKKND